MNLGRRASATPDYDYNHYRPAGKAQQEKALGSFWGGVDAYRREARVVEAPPESQISNLRISNLRFQIVERNMVERKMEATRFLTVFFSPVLVPFFCHHLSVKEL
jgi:hypothetical protein